MTEDLLRKTTLNLIESRDDGPNKKNVVDILDEGGFFLPLDHHLLENITKYMRRQTLATSINVLWHMDSVNAWIVRSKPPGGQTCHTDQRIVPMAKVCLDDGNDWTYFVAGTDDFPARKKKEFPHLHLLPGWDTLLSESITLHGIPWEANQLCRGI